MLLDEIIDLAVDSKQPIGTLLRKCVVLAHHLNNDKLKAWANSELNGYDSIDGLPEYRVLPAPASGTFVGPGWAQVTQGIPSVSLDKEHREFAEIVYIMQPVSVLETALREGQGDSLKFPWNDNLVLFYRSKLNAGWQLFSAYQSVPKSAVGGIVETVRNNMLKMALEIQGEVGDKADLKNITAAEAQKVAQTIVNNISGGNVYMSTGNSSMTATTIQQQNLGEGNWHQLEAALENVGIAGPDLKALSEAVKSDGSNKLEETGSVMKWVKASAPKVLTGGVKIGAAVGQTILTELLLRYYGLKK